MSLQWPQSESKLWTETEGFLLCFLTQLRECSTFYVLTINLWHVSIKSVTTWVYTTLYRLNTKKRSLLFPTCSLFSWYDGIIYGNIWGYCYKGNQKKFNGSHEEPLFLYSVARSVTSQQVSVKLRSRDNVNSFP